MASNEKSGSNDGVGSPALPSTVVKNVVASPQPGPAQMSGGKERQQAQQVQQQLNQKTDAAPVPTTPAAAAAEAKRRFETAQIDQHLMPFLQGGFAQQGADGYFAPSDAYRTNVQVLQACDAKNRQLQRQSEFTNQLLSDPYATTDELVQHSPTVKKLMQEFAEFRKSVDDRFQPVQQHTEQQVFNDFVNRNAYVLFDKDGKLTAAGSAFDKMTQKGMSPEDALDAVQPFIEAQQAMAAAAVAKPKPKAKPVRTIDRITARVRSDGTRPMERHRPEFKNAMVPRHLNDLDSLWDEAERN